MKVKRRLNLIDRIFLWINFAFAIALPISYAAPVTDPAKCWPVAFFGLGYTFIVLANLIMIVYWLLRRKIWILLPVLCIAVGWNDLNKIFGFRLSTARAVKSDTSFVRLMTYNVHNFKRFGFENDTSTKNDILAIIKDKQPDIIGIQEFYSRRRGSYDMIDAIQQIMHTNQYYFQDLQASSSEGIGIAVFSKFPIIAHGFIQLSPDLTSENQCVYVDIKKGGKTFRVYSFHLQSVRFGAEDYHYLSQVSGQGKADVGSTKRLGSKLKTAFVKRSEQVTMIKQEAEKCPYPYILSGDFNDTPVSYSVNQMAKGLKNAFVEAGSGLGVTYNGAFPNFQIDYIMCSPAFDVKGYDIIKKKLSDHYPVYADLLLK